MQQWMHTKPTLLAVFAHPDDETFRPGGTLMLLARSGVQVQVLTATRGEAGSRGDPPLCTSEELAAVREKELHCACAVLGLQPPRLMDYPDGSLAEVDFSELLANILAVIEATQPQVMLSFSLDGLSAHPDHIAIGRASREAYHQVDDIAALYTVAIPLSVAQRLNMRQVRPVPDVEIDLSVDVTPVWETKLAAIRCHATQLGVTPLLRAPEEQQRLFFGQEYFVKAAERRPEHNFLYEALKEFLL